MAARSPKCEFVFRAARAGSVDYAVTATFRCPTHHYNQPFRQFSAKERGPTIKLQQSRDEESLQNDRFRLQIANVQVPE